MKTVSNPQYGAMIIYDESGEIEVYGSYSADGEKRYSEMTEKPVKGDKVVLSCLLQNYNGKAEIYSAWILSFEEGKVDTDLTNYADMTATAVRDADEGTKVKLDGVVARITYANGMKPSGFYLVDGTNSIYVYDGDAAGQVKIGNTVTVYGSKTYWILEAEQQNAAKFGYKGCCQIDEVAHVEVENTTVDFDKSWIKTSTVKAMMETPVSENVTTTIFKVNALVKKAVGTGFTNYYFNDIDGVTGTYTYTQCNGSDFAWLDEFDGKICTVYLSLINAKSTSSGCNWRLLPIAVIDEGYTFSKDDAPKYAVDYVGFDQFQTVYTGDPSLELVTSVSSELLGFTGATLSYKSSDQTIISFTTENGKTVMHCLKSGKATVTITGALSGKSYAKTLEISVVNPEDFDYISVKDAIAAEVGDTVVVKGIVGPSLVNRDGFYLFNGDAMIAVLTTTDALATLELGQEIIIEAERDLFHNKDGNHYGQTCLTGAVIKANLYGKHDYSTDFFVTGKTAADLYALDVSKDYSTSVYVVKATVTKEGNNFYTNYKLTDGTTKLSVYCSSANQYKFLEEFADKEVTLELAPCNWNDKSYYAFCVLAVRTADGKVINTLNFDVN